MQGGQSVSTPGCHAAVLGSIPVSPLNWRLSHIEEVAKKPMAKPSATDVIVLGGGVERVME